MTGRAEKPRLARERNDFFLRTRLADLHGHALPGIAANEEAFDRVIDTRAKEGKGGLKPRRIGALKRGIVIVENQEQRALMEHPSAILDPDLWRGRPRHTQEQNKERALGRLPRTPRASFERIQKGGSGGSENRSGRPVGRDPGLVRRALKDGILQPGDPLF